MNYSAPQKTQYVIVLVGGSKWSEEMPLSCTLVSARHDESKDEGIQLLLLFPTSLFQEINYRACEQNAFLVSTQNSLCTVNTEYTLGANNFNAINAILRLLECLDDPLSNLRLLQIAIYYLISAGSSTRQFFE